MAHGVLLPLNTMMAGRHSGGCHQSNTLEDLELTHSAVVGWCVAWIAGTRVGVHSIVTHAVHTRVGVAVVDVCKIKPWF